MNSSLPQPAGLAILSQNYSGRSEEGMETQVSFHCSFSPAQPDVVPRFVPGLGQRQGSTWKWHFRQKLEVTVTWEMGYRGIKCVFLNIHIVYLTFLLCNFLKN